MNEAENASALCPTGAELVMTSLTVSPTSRAAWYIDGILTMEGVRSFGALDRSSSRLTTAWVVARLPAASRTMTRSPGTSHVYILRNVEIESTPALVRVSDMKTRPRSILRPTQ